MFALLHIVHCWGQKPTIIWFPLFSGIQCCDGEVLCHSHSCSFEQRQFYPPRDMLRIFSLFTVAEIWKWRDLLWIFWNPQGKFLALFPKSFTFIFFILSGLPISWMVALLDQSFNIFIISFLVVISGFLLIFLRDFPTLSSVKSSFFSSSILISKNLSALFFYHSWIKASCFWLMGAALPLIPLRLFSVRFVCVEKFHSVPSALFLFPPKYFPAWMILVCFILKAFLQNQTTSGCSFTLKTQITQSDVWVCFEACGQGLSAGEFHWQRPGSEPAFPGWDPKWHSLQDVSL